MNYTHSKEIIAYLKAVDNEIAIDEMGYAIMNTTAKAEGYFPRPSKSLKYLSKFPRIFKWSLIIMWAYLLYFLFFYFQYIKSLLSLSKYEKIILDDEGHKNIAIAFSEKATEIINKINIGKEIDYWLVFNWIDSTKIDQESPKLNLLSILDHLDLKKALELSIAAHKEMRRSSNYGKWISQSYICFQWFLVRIALEKLDGDFLIAEHFDRWAVLVDDLVGNKISKGKSVKYSLVQHGIVGDISNNISLNLPYKLIYTSEIFVYDKYSEQEFKNNVLSVDNQKYLKFINFFNNKLFLSDLNCGEKKTVLIVGNPVCEDLHVYLISKLIALNHLQVYYKPHPLTPASRNIRDQNLEVINDKSLFPRVDLVISYPSTLELEYRNLRIKTFTHPIDMKVNSAGPFLEEVLSWINKF